MNKLRSRELNRVVGSFLLAVGLHALLFLLQINGIWGASGGGLDYTLIHPRVIELEPPKAAARTAQVKVTPEEKTAPQPKPPAPAEPPARSIEEAVARLEEVHQEQPASRETKAEPGEPVTTRPEEPAPPSETEAETGEAQTVQAPEVPALPPLGSAGGMVLFAPGFSYPKSAEHRGLEGTVQLELYLNPEGRLLSEPQILVSSGHTLLDDYCLRILKSGEWKFKPAPQPYKILFEVRFEDYKVEPRYIGEAVYLSPEEGGEINESKDP
ncbi:MAG: TonB family protein [Firmicutes bacterium]|nr:TonB family protein [Bacillota bacterium]